MRDAHQLKIIETAKAMGMTVVDLMDEWETDAIRVEYQGKSELIFKGRIYSNLSHQADFIANNKSAAKHLMKDLGIPVPDELIIESAFPDLKAIERFIKKHPTCVVKPLDGTDGIGILMDCTTTDQAAAQLFKLAASYPKAMLEAQVPGDDLRIQAIGGKMVAACIRIPCTLVGDGLSPIKELIKARNHEIAQQNPTNLVEVDEQVYKWLKAANLTLDSILPEGQKQRIKDVANMSQGAKAIDITDEIHPEYDEWIQKISEALNLSIFSLDGLSADPSANPNRFCKIIEINARPAWLHHTFSEGKQHDIARMVLEELMITK